MHFYVPELFLNFYRVKMTFWIGVIDSEQYEQGVQKFLPRGVVETFGHFKMVITVAKHMVFSKGSIPS